MELSDQLHFRGCFQAYPYTVPSCQQCIYASLNIKSLP